jgi:hypothetical protein
MGVIVGIIGVHNRVAKILHDLRGILSMGDKVDALGRTSQLGDGKPSGKFVSKSPSASATLS